MIRRANMRMGELCIGQTASFSKTISEADVYLFAGVTGDMNPVHIDEIYAKSTRFKNRIVHGMLSAGLISAVIGTRLPGPGSIYVSQTLNFLAPVNFYDTITATVEVSEIIHDRNRVRLKTICTNQNGVVVTGGEAVMIASK